MALSSPAIQLTTRPATAGDIPLLRQLAERIWRVCYPSIIPVEQIEFMLGWMYSAEQIAQELGDGVAWEIAISGEQPIGFFSVGFEEPARVKLHKLYLLPERQGSGLGQALLERAHEVAASRGAREIWLQVNKKNTQAIRAYERAGYGVERSAVFDIGHGFVMDDFIMHRPLPPRPALNAMTTPSVSA